MADRDPGESWSLSKERAFTEDILCQRFNFLLVFYSLVLAGALATESELNFKISLTLGALFTFLLTIAIGRVQYRLDCVINSLGPLHPARLKDSKPKKEPPFILRYFVKKSKRRWIGYWIPLLLTLSLALGAFLALIECLEP